MDKPTRYKVDSYTHEGAVADAVRIAVQAFQTLHPGCTIVSHAHQFDAHDGRDVVVTVVYEERDGN